MGHGKDSSGNGLFIKKFLKLTLIYFILFLALLSMVDYYAMMVLNLPLIVGIAILIALPVGYSHARKGKHTHIDDVVDEIL